MAKKVEVVFQPEGKRAESRPGETILNTARRIGVDISSICGGRGSCGKCKVIIREGWENMDQPTPEEQRFLSREEKAEHYRLACSSIVKGSVVVEVPPRSRLGKQRLQIEGIEVLIEPEPLMTKHFVAIKPPTLGDQRSDMDRLLDALREQHGLEQLTMEYEVVKRLPKIVRESRWTLTAVIWNREKIVALEPGDSTSRCYGLAVDIGTTKMAGFLVDLVKGEVVATCPMVNPQIPYGEDIISRITYATRGAEGLKKLQGLVIGGINQMLRNCCKEADIDPKEVYEVAAVGNTAMHHIFLGIYPRHVALSPYPPAVRRGLNVGASKLGVRAHPQANIYVLPNIGGFVGADNVGVILATRMHESEEVTLTLDIGTNTEIVLGNKEDILVCSCASGPAFEGAHITHGMRALTGAIERIAVDPETLEVSYRTIDDAKPVGICGSALVDAPAEMLKAGIINVSGAFMRDLDHPRVRRDGSPEFVVAWSEETATGRDIVITQGDIRELQKAKAAMHAGAAILMARKKIMEEDIDRVLIAGAFGSYVDPESARTIGMYPEVPLGKVRVVGNAAGTGAKMALISREERRKAEEISQRVRYYELAADPRFEKEFIDSLHLPHRNLTRYPVTVDLLRRLGRL
ncbi:MAG: ASKHA domain-containing protein [Candidatus Geothermarchaeales archaeon]